MKRTLFAVLALVAGLAMTGCASSTNASITNGSVTGLRSHEATTLVKADIRKAKVEQVQTAYKPIFKVTAIKGQTIEFKGVESLEVNVPLNLAELLSEQPDSESENVQMAKQVVRFGEKVVAPVAVVKMLSDDRKDAHASNERIANINAQAQREENAADAAQTSALLEAVTEKPPFFVLPAGATAVNY